MGYMRLQDTKLIQCVWPQILVDDGPAVGAQGNTPVSVDTVGWNEAMVVFGLGATDIAVDEFNVFDSDDDSTYAEIPGLSQLTGADGTSPSATEDNSLFPCYIDLKNKKRYLQVAWGFGNGTVGGYGYVLVVLAKPDVAPNTAAERGGLRELFA